jgi:hypothetical protein
MIHINSIDDAIPRSVENGSLPERNKGKISLSGRIWIISGREAVVVESITICRAVR